MADAKPSEDEIKDGEDKDEPTLNLDEVHAKALNEIENENNENDPKDEEDPKEDDNKEPEKDEEEDDSEDKDEDKEAVGDAPEASPDPEPTPPPAKEADALPPVEEEFEKVILRDADGKSHEFSTTDEIPDDFEPYSYKEFAVGTSKLAQREIAVARATEQREIDIADKERSEAIAKTRKKWQDDEESLVKAGAIPEDADERKTIVDGVYGVMQDEVNKGEPVNSFKQAFELYQYRQSQKPDDKKKSERNADKKRRGGKVMAGSGANPPKSSNQAKVYEAPPSGVTLDQIHEKTLGSL